MAGNATPEADGGSGLHDLGGWNEEVARFASKRGDSYGVLLEEMRTSRSLAELAAVQQRWWLHAMQDYVGLTGRLYGRESAPDQEDGPSS